MLRLPSLCVQCNVQRFRGILTNTITESANFPESFNVQESLVHLVNQIINILKIN
jgi:hypothetical protein